MNHDKSLPIIEAAYRLALQLNKAVVKFPRHQRGGLGRRIEEAAFNFLEALTAARYRNLGSKMEFERRVASPQDPRSGWILKLDVKDFYPSLHHDVILRQLKTHINDGNLVKLISQFLSVWAGWDTPDLPIFITSGVSSLLISG